jgi:hypothetical protein
MEIKYIRLDEKGQAFLPNIFKKAKSKDMIRDLNFLSIYSVSIEGEW